MSTTNAMQRIFKPAPVTSREWALFGVRWAVPLGLAVFIAGEVLKGSLSPQVGGLIGAVALLATVSTLLMLIFLVNRQWYEILNFIFIGVDIILAVASVAVSNITIGWVG